MLIAFIGLAAAFIAGAFRLAKTHISFQGETAFVSLKLSSPTTILALPVRDLVINGISSLSISSGRTISQPHPSDRMQVRVKAAMQGQHASISITRIQLLSNTRIDIKSLPQPGRFIVDLSPCPQAFSVASSGKVIITTAGWTDANTLPIETVDVRCVGPGMQIIFTTEDPPVDLLEKAHISGVRFWDDLQGADDDMRTDGLIQAKVIFQDKDHQALEFQRGDSLDFTGIDARIHSFELLTKSVSLTLSGTTHGLDTVIGDSRRSLMPTYYEKWKSMPWVQALIAAISLLTAVGLHQMIKESRGGV
jgi:hypothetical protein